MPGEKSKGPVCKDPKCVKRIISEEKRKKQVNSVILILFVIVVISFAVIYYVSNPEKVTPAQTTTTLSLELLIDQNEDICAGFPVIVDGITCVKAVRLAMENYGASIVTDIEETDIEGKKVYSVTFEEGIVIGIDSDTGELVNGV